METTQVNDTVGSPAGNSRRAASYHIIYRDGEVKSDLSKADAQTIIADDDNSGNIAKVLKGFEVGTTTKKVTTVMLDA